MANYLQSIGREDLTPGQSRTLKTTAPTTTTKKFNLFDFSTVKKPTMGSITQSSQVIPKPKQLNFAPQSTAGATFQAPTTPKLTQAKPTSFSNWVVPQANAETTQTPQPNIIQEFLTNTKTNPEFTKKRNAVIEMLKNGEDETWISDVIVKDMGYKSPQEEPGFIGGALGGIKDIAVGGIKRIGEAGVGLAEGKYRLDEALFRGGAGALETTFSPISGIIGEGIKTGIENIPKGFKDYISTKTTPTIQDVKMWYDSQSPEQKRQLDNIGVGLELLLNFAGVKGAQKISPGIKQVGKEGIEQTGKIISKGVKAGGKVITKTGEGITGATEYSTKLLTGLNRETQQAIKQNPKLFAKIKSGEISAEQIAGDLKTNIIKRLENLSETGKGYQELKKSNIIFPKKDIQKIINNRLKTEGLSKELIELPLEDRSAIKQAQAYLNELKTPELTTKEAIELKAKLRSLVSYDKGVSPEGERVVKGLIKDLDTELKTKIPGFKELDATYGPEREFLNKVQKDLFNKDGTLKENAISTIRNLTGKGKEFKIERFEEIMPGITQKVKGIKAFEDLQNAIEGKTGSYARGVILGGGGYAVGGPLGGIASFVLTHPSVASKALEIYGLNKQKVINLINKIKGKKLLTGQEQKEVINAMKVKPNKLFNNIIENDKLTTITNTNNISSNIKQTTKELKPAFSSLKNKTEDILDKTAEKVGARKNIVENRGIGADKTKMLNNDLVSEAKKYNSFDEFKKIQDIKKKDISIKWGGDDYKEYLKDPKFLKDFKDIIYHYSEPVVNFREPTNNVYSIQYGNMLKYLFPNENPYNIKTEKNAIDWIKTNKPASLNKVIKEIKEAKIMLEKRQSLEKDYIPFAIGYNGENALLSGISNRPLSVTYAGQSAYEGQKIVSNFGKNTGFVYINKDANVFPVRDTKYSSIEKELVIPPGSKIRNINIGYTGYGTKQINTYVDVPNTVKTEAQLKQIYEQATKPTILKPKK